MAANDPFRGMRLSEQSGPTKLEQQLFAPTPTPKPPAVKPPEPEQSAPRRLMTTPAAPAAPTEKLAAVRPASLATPRFKLAEEPLHKATYVFTQPELEALEDLKLELRRGQDAKVTKNDLIRSALHMLIEDYAANGTRSYASRKVRGK